MAFQPTSQQDAIRSAVRTGETVVVDALAGAGKTSTALLAAQDDPRRLISYVAFNRPIADEAARRFPNNTTARTSHSFAFRSVMTQRPALKARLDTGGFVPAWKQAQILRLPDDFRFGLFRMRDTKLATLVSEAVTRFCHSAEPEPQGWMIPKVPGLDTPAALDAFRVFLLPFVQRAWEDLKSDKGQLRFHHDCQPSGTLVRVSRYTSGGGMGVGGSKTEWVEVPIEDVRVGDRVVSWTGDTRLGYIRRSGREVMDVGSRHFTGDLISITTDRGRTSSYTPGHICVVRLDSDFTDGNYIVYLMRQGNKYRVGRTTWRTRSQSNNLGIIRRAWAGKADAMWVLSVHASDEEAALAEALTSYRFGLPSWRFHSVNEVMPLEKFWAEVGDNTDRAINCLSEFGRDIQYPFWVPGVNRVRRPLEVRACNLISGMKVCEMDDVKASLKGALTCNDGSGGWSSIKVVRTPYDGLVYNMNVDVDHTYVADGIVTHNCYLKLFSLSDYCRLPGDLIIMDEAQDINPVTKLIVDRQNSERGAQILVIGDTNQQIYSWRGAVDSLNMYDTPHRLPLTKSFRFGSAIADEANRILEWLDTPLRVEGHDPVHSVLGHLDAPDTVLTRTNAAAIGRLMESQLMGVQTGLVGGTQQVEYLAKAALDLTLGRPTTHPDLIAFDTWRQVQEYVEDAADAGQLKVLVKLVDTHGAEKLLDAVAQAVPEQGAELLISTAHKAKGKEWDRVQLAGDFPNPEEYDLGGMPDEELRLAYVAVTRAKEVLDSSALSWLADVDRTFLAPAELPERAVVVVRPRIQIAQLMIDPESDNRVIMQGTPYSKELVAAQKELLSDLPGSSFRGEWAGFAKVRVVLANQHVLRVAQQFGLTISDEARERIEMYS